jgi:hypothetical protein
VRKIPERESDVEDYLVGRVKAAGGEIRKVKWEGRSGAPDRRVMLPGACVWVELKAPGRVEKFPATPHERAQHREHERMRAQGEVVLVLDSYAGIDKLFPQKA